MTAEIIEKPVTDLLQWAKKFPAKTEQLAYDMTRLMQVTEENISDVQGKPFFNRVLDRITAADKRVQVETNQQLLDLQKLAQQRLLDLQQQSLLTAEAIIGVQNNLSTLAAKNEETQRQITLMAERVRERFLEMEERVGVLEVNSRIHSWLLTIETYDYNLRYPTGLRTLKVIQDFIKIKGNEWNLQEIKFLQKGLKEAGLPWKEKLSTGMFIDMLVDEIEGQNFQVFEQLLPLNTDTVSTKFVTDNISVATFSALYQIADKYQHSADTIEILQDSMELTRAEAIRMVLRKYVKKQGVDLDVEIPLKDIAIEILSCTALATSLTKEKKKPITENIWTEEITHLENGSLEEKTFSALRHYYGISTPINHGKSFPLLSNNYERGCIVSGWYLAESYQNGLGVPRDENLADNIYSHLKNEIVELAKQGDIFAQLIIFVEDDSNDISYIDCTTEERKQLLEKSAQSNPVAMEYLYFQDHLSDQEKEVIIRQSARLGYSEGIFELAELQYSKDNKLEACELYQQAVELDHLDSHYELALCYLYGLGLNENRNTAIELSEKGFKLGALKCGVLLVELNTLSLQQLDQLKIRVMTSEDSDLIVKLAEKIMDSDNVYSFDQAEDLLNQSSKLGNGRAKYLLAIKHKAQGNTSEYMSLIKESAELGELSSLIYLGIKYYRGGAPYSRNPLKSFETFERATTVDGCDEEKALANFWLGRLHYYGYGTPRDYKSAYLYLTESIKLGGEHINEYESCLALQKLAYQNSLN